MFCEQAGEMMSARLDGHLDSTEIAILENHLVSCSACQAEWHSLQALDRALASAPMMRAPVHLRVQIMARLSRKEQVRRAIIGGTALALGTVALALLALVPIFVGLLDATGFAPALVSGGPETLTQLLALLGAIGRTILILADKFATPIVCLGLFCLMTALALNGLWLGAVRRLRPTY
ncbi:MAG: zf-HC2 domain-containing protein [Chloroflexota bacterium]|nr:zf-HC2 domain-containing protein [Chloroflexota bacterium]